MDMKFFWQTETLFSFPGGQTVKNLPAMQETQVRPLGQEESLEKEMAEYLPGQSH